MVVIGGGEDEAGDVARILRAELGAYLDDALRSEPCGSTDGIRNTIGVDQKKITDSQNLAGFPKVETFEDSEGRIVRRVYLRVLGG